MIFTVAFINPRFGVFVVSFFVEVELKIEHASGMNPARTTHVDVGLACG